MLKNQHLIHSDYSSSSNSFDDSSESRSDSDENDDNEREELNYLDSSSKSFDINTNKPVSKGNNKKKEEDNIKIQPVFES